MALPDILPLEYDFIDNGAGALMMVTQSFPEAPEDAVFYFDGAEQALFCRRSDRIAPLSYIPAAVRRMLAEIGEILVVEINENEELTEVYRARVVIPEDGLLPYPPEFLNAVNVEEDEE